MSQLRQLRRNETSTTCSDHEMETRIDLAACYRMTAEYRMADQCNGFIGARIKDDPAHYLTKPFGEFPEEVTASSLLKLPVRGDVVIGKGTDYNVAAIHMVQAVMQAHPEVGCVFHAHTKATMVLSSLKTDLLPISQPAFMLYGKLAFSDFEFDCGPEFCTRLLHDLGNAKVMLMRNHGMFIAARDVPEAMFLAFSLDQACTVQVEALQTRVEINVPDLQKVAVWSDQYAANDHIPYDGSLEWPAILRKLDRKDPSFRN